MESGEREAREVEEREKTGGIEIEVEVEEGEEREMGGD